MQTKLLIVSIIIVLTFHKEIFSLIGRFLKSNKSVKPVVIPEMESSGEIDFVEPQVSIQSNKSDLLSYEQLKAGADRIIRTDFGSRSNKVRLMSYVYVEANVVRRVVFTSKRERISFGMLPLFNINEEAANFKLAYSAYLNSSQPVSEPSEQLQSPVTPKAIPETPAKKVTLASYTGKIVSLGFAPYNGSGTVSYVVDIETDDGPRKLYGSGLERALKDASLGKGDVVTLTKMSAVDVHDGNSGSKTSKAKIWTAIKQA
ncbi:MAG: hypothetical protein ACTS9Y_00945 [Methylophilus sp.]|uniref:hypothetical protein n=1 Tax=Methylophilus sp. TaxID=29541 RepID=UPI003F9EE677